MVVYRAKKHHIRDKRAIGKLTAALKDAVTEALQAKPDEDELFIDPEIEIWLEIYRRNRSNSLAGASLRFPSPSGRWEDCIERHVQIILAIDEAVNAHEQTKMAEMQAQQQIEAEESRQRQIAELKASQQAGYR